MKRFFRMLRLCCQHTLDLLFPVDPPFCQRIPLQEDDTYELENIKLEQQRQAYLIETISLRLEKIKDTVTEIALNLEGQINTMDGEHGYRDRQQSAARKIIRNEIKALRRIVTQVDNEHAQHRRDIANCMKLIKHQHSVMNSFKVTSINPSVN